MHRKTPSARPVGVLIASEQEWTSRSLASILAPQGYLVLKAFTRGQTLTHIRRAPPDAIIIDEQLPDGDGLALCRELYDQDMIAPSTPVFLALSHAPTRRDRLAALRAGAWSASSFAGT
jgi:DNA-binding response OmpR family regulator